MFFCNPREFACFISSMAQDNMLISKIRTKSKWIRLNKFNEFKSMRGDLYVLRNVWPQCISSKVEGVFRKMEGWNWNCK